MPKIRIPGIKLRKEKKQEPVIEGLEFIEKPRISLEEKKPIAIKTRYRGYEVIEEYPIEEPWVYVKIMHHKTRRDYLYLVEEVKLTKNEQTIYKDIMDALYWELEPPPADADPIRYFEKQAEEIVYKYQIRLGRTPGISWRKILYYVKRDAVGFGRIDPLMKDPNIEDISCNGPNRPVYVWHRKYEYIPTNIIFVSEEDLDKFVVKLAHMAGKHISIAFPVLDAILPGGHRLAATYRKEVTTGGSSFTIRKFKETPLTVTNLVEGRSLSPELAAYFWILMEHKRPGLVLGVTGSGKTTTLNTLLTMLKPTVKVVTIEDTPELRLPLENWVQLIPRMSYGFGTSKASEITLYDLVKISLRYRPDIIVVGEVRGEEAYVLFQAIATGHGGLTSLHAEHIDAAIKRLTSPPMNIPEGYIPLMNFATLVRRVEIVDPKTGRVEPARRITTTWEIRGHGDYVKVHYWDPRTDTHILEIEKSFLLKNIAEQRGWTIDDVKEEIIRRAVVIRWLQLRRIDFYKDVAEIIHKYYQEPERIFREATEEIEAYGGKLAGETIV